jgi:ABC-type arginine transport system permease subunit
MKTTVALCVLTFIVGFIVGMKISAGEKYQAGQLSACHDMLGIAVAAIPPLAVVNPTCEVFHGEVAIRLNDKFFSLDGKRQLN